mmetsp:Transcript_32416/g.36812  ORF Transcript_32416/g.36812 Transcript_32416/m.36812 type:complete len:472 (+) Transcript_32416:218-1633(+)
MFHLSDRRCFSTVGCDGNVHIPNERPIISCRGGCGITYCSDNCQNHMFESGGHKYACANMRANKEKKRRGDTSVGQETAEEKSEAENLVRRNSSVPCVIIDGEISSRRFRQGQRVLCITPKGWAPGTVTDLYYDASDNNDVPLKLYEIQRDDGLFCSAPDDNDSYIRREVGSPVIINRVTQNLPEDMIDAIKEEMDSGWSKYNTASSMKRWEKLKRRVCSGCGKRSKKKLPVCTRCETACYCSVACQKNHYKDHRKACKEVAKQKKQFVDENPDIIASRDVRRFIKSQSLSVNRMKTLETFLLKHLKMPYGAVRFLTRIADIARDAQTASLSDDPHETMSALAKKEVENPFSQMMYDTTQMFCLTAAMIHFQETAPDLAHWCASVIDLFQEVSRNGLILYPTQPDTGGRYCYGLSCYIREDAEGVTKRFCSQCKAVWYCSRACQIEDWKRTHKIRCKLAVDTKQTLCCQAL